MPSQDGIFHFEAAACGPGFDAAADQRRHLLR